MINDTISLLAAWAAHADHGVNELAQSLPRKRTSGYPDDACPPTVTIYTDVDDKGVARELDPPKAPALVFWGASDADAANSGYPTAKKVTIAAAYVTEETADPMVAKRDCGYILRGARISFLKRYNKIILSEAFRTINGIRVIEITDINEHRVTAAVGRRAMWGFLEINATVIETLS